MFSATNAEIAQQSYDNNQQQSYDNNQQQGYDNNQQQSYNNQQQSYNNQQQKQSGPVYQELTGNGFPMQNNENVQNQEKQSSNIFLEYYTRQGTKLFHEDTKFFFQGDDGELKKKAISSSDLKKAVVIFFGEWCPHCNQFLTQFARHISLLESAGISVILVDVPTIERLKNWQDPNVDEFNAAENKIASYNIPLSHKGIYVTMIGSREILAECGVEGLPVLVAVKDGKEMFRTSGSSAMQKMDLNNNNVLQQFLSIWTDKQDNDNATDTDKKTEAKNKKSKSGSHSKVKSSSKTKSHTKSSKSRAKTQKNTKQTLGKTNWKKARELADHLNSFDPKKFRQPGLLFY